MLKYLNFKYSDGRIEMKVHSVYYPLCRILIINLCQTKLKEIFMAFIDEIPSGRKIVFYIQTFLTQSIN